MPHVHGAELGEGRSDGAGMSGLIDITGQRFGRLVVLCRIPSDSTAGGTVRTRWKVLCDCGNLIETRGHNLRSGDTKSCGCLIQDVLAERNHKHGHCSTRTYRIWLNMKQRCNNPANKNWADYGGRGIRICERWRDFSAFFLDMGEAPAWGSIDRINNDGGYEPGNCRWATQRQQCQNTRRNRFIEFNGEIKPLSEWARDLGVHIATLHYRVNHWALERALSKHREKEERTHASI